MPDTERIFSEEEIGLVLKRAAEIQGKQPRTPSYGLSMDELRQLAQDSGIDPAIVVTAAMELDSDRESEKTSWWGGPAAATVLRTIDGRISDETWEEMLADLRKEYGETGIIEQRGATRQWMFSSPEQRKAHLIATYGNGQTKLELFWSDPTTATPYALGTIVSGILSLPLIFAALRLSAIPGFTTWFVLLTSVLIAARFGFAGAVKKRKRDLRRTADRITQIAKRGRGSEGATAPVQTSTGEREVPAKEVTTHREEKLIEVPDDEYAGSEKMPGARRGTSTE